MSALLGFPQFHSSRWDGDVAELSWSNLNLRFDTAKREAREREVEPKETADKKPIQHQHEFPGGAKVRLVELKARKYQGEDSLGLYQLEGLKPGEKRPEVILAKCLVAQFLPSPDRKFLLMDCLTGLGNKLNNMEPRLIVVDAKGKVVADMKPEME